MISRFSALAAVACAAALSFPFPAEALTSKECSVKWKAAQAAGTTGGMKYAEYRKAECGTGAAAAPTTSPPATPAAVPAPTTPPAATPRPTARTQPNTPITPSDAVFPTAVSAKYSTETAGKQRMHTCLDQYKANKASNANGGLKWIQKGGGYYSQCNTRLKGA